MIPRRSSRGPPHKENDFPLNELRTAGLLLGNLCLGVTAWVVSDNRPGTATSLWPAVFMAIGMLYAGLVPSLIQLASPAGAAAELFAAAFHLLPLGAVLWFSAAALDGTAYAQLAPWLWLGFAASAALALGGMLWRRLRTAAG